MKSKFDRYMKENLWYTVAVIIYYLFIYMVVRILLSVIIGSYELSIGYDILCYLFSFILIILTFYSYENNDNSPNAT